MPLSALVLALILRLLIMPFFYHPDIKSQLFHSQFLSQGVLNIYQFVDQNKNHLPYTNIYVYLPFTYYFFGLINIIFKPFYPPDLLIWLNDWSFQQNNYPNLPFMLLILKIPYLIFDLLIALLLFRLYRQKKIVYLWLFNPFSLYLIYIQGNFDIVPVFFTFLAYYLLHRQKKVLGFISLGLAVALKMYPLLFLPFFLIKYSYRLKNYIFYASLTFLPLIFSVLPFLSTPAFFQSFFGSGLTQKIIELKFFTLPVFPIIYLILLIYFYLNSKKSIEKTFFYLFLIFIILVDFHAQWLLWFLPFILLFTPFNWLFLSLSVLYIFLTNDNFLFWGHLTPIDWEFTRVTSPFNLLTLKFHLSPLLIQTYIKYLILFISVPLLVFHEKLLSPHHS